MIDEYCAKHGWLSHCVIHEVAHAVAAVDRGIPFKKVSILPPGSWMPHPEGGAMVGGVEMLSDQPSDWVLPNPLTAMEFAMAGSLAEDGAYGHHLEDGYLGDFRLWRIGVGLVDSTSQEEIEAALGESLSVVFAGVRAWLIDAGPRIRMVAAALASVADTPGYHIVDYSSDLSLSEAEVLDLLSEHP